MTFKHIDLETYAINHGLTYIPSNTMPKYKSLLAKNEESAGRIELEFYPAQFTSEPRYTSLQRRPFRITIHMKIDRRCY